jgi:hypothetical protein
MYEQETNEVLSLIESTSDLVFFVGSGISRQRPSSYPSWKNATEEAVEKASVKGLRDVFLPGVDTWLTDRNYYAVFQLLKNEFDKATYEQILREVFELPNRSPNPNHEFLIQIPGCGVITTNFDPFIEDAYSHQNGRIPLVASYYEEEKIRTVIQDTGRYFVVKMHGDLDVISRIVLTREQCDKVAANPQVEMLLSALSASKQFFILGYGLKDPDFQSLWDGILFKRYLHKPAIVCCPVGQFQSDELSNLKERNFHVVQFENEIDSYAYLPVLLKRLQDASKSARRFPATTLPEPVCPSRTDEYFYLYTQFSSERRSRLVSFVGALCLGELCSSPQSAYVLSHDTLFRTVKKMLGVGSETIESIASQAVAHLREQSLIRIEGEKVILLPEVQKTLDKLRRNLVEGEHILLGRVLAECAPRSEIQEEHIEHLSRIVEEIFLWFGRELAEEILFSRIPESDELLQIRSIVKKVCKKHDLNDEIFLSAIDRLFYDMSEDEEEWFYQKLQAYFLASAFVLHPTSERLLKSFAEKHQLFLDSSVILPLLAERHPLQRSYADLLNRSRRVGVRLFVSRGMLNEVLGHLGKAITWFRDLDNGFIAKNLEAATLLMGDAQGNVFLDGFRNVLRADTITTWQKYVDHITFSKAGGTRPDRGKILDVLRTQFGVEFLDFKMTDKAHSEVERLIEVILQLRPRRSTTPGGRILSKDEAQQFYLIHYIRVSDETLRDVVWFLTTDVHLLKLQAEEKERYPSPIVYLPSRWSQYLDLIDHRVRSSRNFSKLMKKLQYGIFTGDAAMTLVKSSIAKLRQVQMEGKVKELLESATHDYYAQQELLPEPQGICIDQSEEREELVGHLQKTINGYVISRQEDLDNLRTKVEQLEAGNAESEGLHGIEVAKLTKRLAKQKHHIQVLRAELKSSKQK